MPNPRHRVSIQLTITETPAAKRVYSIPVKLQATIKRAVRLVTERSLSGLESIELGIVTLNDQALLEMNNRILGHDWYTDILSFEIDRSETALSAEIYLSVERARENAGKYRTKIDRELLRLVIHGLLHFAGYDDHEAGAKKRMQAQERYFLALLSNVSRK